ncbi:MAG TPA: hypothetical protein PK566_01805 [Pseudobacteroides sp.]|nr:hypothetical protein [Pseudobacteroides sp.]
MKRIFTGIGLLVALFSIYFFLLIADKMVYLNNETIYDFELSKNISSQELKTLAENAQVTIRLVDFKKSDFGKKEMDITFINPDSSIKFGKRPSIFPKEKIVYKALDDKTQKQIKYFTIQENDYKKIENIQSSLEKRGYTIDMQTSAPISFSLGMLFSPLNLGFFSLLTVLLILCIATYYVYRLKEIGILKLNGWSNTKISFCLLLKLLMNLYLSSLFLIIPFGIYVIFSDFNKIVLYVRIYLLLCLFLTLVFLLSAFAGTLFIYSVNQVSAIKNKKNNRLIFNILLVFKIFTTLLLVLSMNTLSRNVYELDSIIKSVNKLEKYNFYRIRTSTIQEDEIHEKLVQLISSLDDKDVYNYATPDSILSITKLKEYQAKGKLRDNNEYSFTSISPNMLDLLHIFDEQGNEIQVIHIDSKEETFLVPIHYKNDIDKILECYQAEDNAKIIYIKNGQIHEDILYPHRFVYDSIYCVHKLQKELYINKGEILLKKKSAEIVEQSLVNMGLDKYSIAVEPINDEYNILRSNAQLDLCESLFHFNINLLSFLLCGVSIVIIFLELRKKEFGVYKLIGKYPIRIIGKFAILNAIITITITLIINPVFTFLLFAEAVIYGVLIFKYIKNKAVLTLKGE